MTLGLICLVKGSFESYCRHHKLWLTDEMKMSSPIFQKFLLHDMDIRIATALQMIPLCWRNEINQSEFWSRAVEKNYLMQSNFICSRQTFWCRAILFAADALYLMQHSFIWCRETLFAAGNFIYLSGLLGHGNKGMKIGEYS